MGLNYISLVEGVAQSTFSHLQPFSKAPDLNNPNLTLISHHPHPIMSCVLFLSVTDRDQRELREVVTVESVEPRPGCDPPSHLNTSP